MLYYYQYLLVMSVEHNRKSRAESHWRKGRSGGKVYKSLARRGNDDADVPYFEAPFRNSPRENEVDIFIFKLQRAQHVV